MPIFRFHGTNEKMVKEYYKHAGEIAQIINTDVKKFVFILENSTVIGNGYEKDAIYVTIDWIGRPMKQEPVAQHIVDFFKQDSKNIYVKFTEINSFLYLNGEMVG